MRRVQKPTRGDNIIFLILSLSVGFFIWPFESDERSFEI
nr:MAG TPA: hypothetical protein [Caudoviricetes sp.]